MSIFCTQCGAKNDDSAVFCEGCGHPLRKPASVTPPQVLTAEPLKINAVLPRKKAIYVGAAIGSALLLGGVALYLVLAPPAASPGKLLAAAKEGYGAAIGVQYKRELCLSNMNYGLTNFNVGERDRSTQTWLNNLVAAGLYSPAVPISSGGYFPETLLQYTATPELAKWRDGGRLCLAKGVDLTEIVEIEKPQEETVGRNADGDPAKLLTVKAQLVLQSTETAPWLEKPEIQTEVLGQLNGWVYKNTKLQKQIPDTFGLRDGAWATGPAFKASIQKQYLLSQRGRNNGANATVNPSDSNGFFAGLSSTLSNLFSFGGHPLKGTWKMDTEPLGKLFGMGLPGGIGLNATMTFTADAMEVSGQSIKCKFEVDGKRVKVTPEGQAVSLIFLMEDNDTASIDMGIMTMKYKRVE